MTTFHAFLGCSLDGYIAGPNGELDWLTAFENTGYEAFFASVDAMAMGRATYDVMREVRSGLLPGHADPCPLRHLAAGPAPGHGPLAHDRPPGPPSLQAGLAEAGAERAYADGGQTVQTFLAAGFSPTSP